MKSIAGMRVVFMGTPAFAVPTLRALLDAECDVRGVVTQPDRPAGRGRQVALPPVKALALERGLPLFQPEKIRTESFMEELRGLAAEVFVVVAYGRILPKGILEIPPMGCINVHASLLPAYRGAAPINWAVARGEKVTGVTTMLIDEGLDSGDMLLRRELPIGEADDASSLYAPLSEMGGELLIETLSGLKAGTVLPERQDERLVSFAPILRKEDGLIDWTKEAGEIVNLVRGMLPWPTAHTTLKGQGLKVYRAEAREGDGEPGRITAIGKDVIEVAAGNGIVALHEVQLEGKKRMNTGDFLRGFPLTEGEAMGR